MRRGVDVRLVADKSQLTARYTSVRFLANRGVPVRINGRYSIMHDKFIVVDGVTVQTGSFNYTRAAEIRNAENVIVLVNLPQVASAYAAEWKSLWLEAQPLPPKVEAGRVPPGHKSIHPPTAATPMPPHE
jgi:phosphatidylserine/phosphatidylglycerophosphate/cardiolipin synthase-like enzyme